MLDIMIPLLIMIAGIILITFSAKIAVNNSAKLASAMGVSQLIIGITLISIGTDLPEIFNSIISCSMGHGDIDVGDSVGSDLTQLTLIFGLLPILAGNFKIERKTIIILGSCEILSLILIYTIVEKGYFTRLNAIIMVSSLILYTMIIYLSDRDSIIEGAEFVKLYGSTKKKSILLSLAVLGFLGITAGAYCIVNSIIEISKMLDVNEYIISFFIAALGTSLPELVVDIHAIKSGHYRLAIGDIVGSCIVDSTLSIGIGQVLFPQAVSAGIAVPTVLYTLCASLIVFTVIAVRKKMDKKAGVLFISLYLLSYTFLFFFI